MEFGTRGIGGEIKLFPPPVYHGELEKWEDWSWQLKRYVGLYKPLAKLLMDDVEGSNVAITDDLCEAFNVQQNRTQNDQLSLFSRQLAYMLAQITDGATRAIVRNEDTENGFEIWRRLHSQFSLPERARSTNLLNEIIGFRLRSDHLESDLSEFIILKNRHEKTTGRPIDNDLLVTLLMQKTVGPLLQHLRLNVRNINTFNEALEIIYSYIKSRHLTVPSGKSDHGGQADMDIGALKGKKGMKGKGYHGGKGMFQRKGKGYKGKGMYKGYKGKGKSKGKGKGMKGKGKGQGCFLCGDPNHWSKECPKEKGRMSALTEEEQGSGAEWYDEWNHWSPDDWSNDDWSWEEQDWNGEWIGSVDDWSGDWSWFEDEWSPWPEDWSWNTQEWWSSAEAQPQSSNGAASSGSNVPQDTAKNEPPQNVSAVTVDSSDQSAPRVAKTVRGTKPGLMTNLFVGAFLLIGALSSGVPPMPNQNVPNLKELPENDSIDFDDSLIGFHMQAGLVDKSWILFDSGACANCCPEWFAPDYPTLPLNESAPSLRSLSGKTLDVQGRKIVQLDCGNGHSLSVQLYVCTGIPFPLVSVARLLLQDFWTVMAKDYMALIDPTGNPVPIVRQGTLVYLTPTVIPYGVANAARLAATCLPEVMSGIEEELGALELRGVSDVHDCSIDHLCQIGALIASAQGMRSSEGGRQDTWEVNETELKLIRHVKVWRNEMLDPRIKLANRMPVPVLRLTGERLTHKVYRDGSTVTVRDANFLTMTNTRPRDEKDWRGRVEFGLMHKPQRRHVQKSAPRPHDPMVGKPPQPANADIAEMEHKSETASKVRARTGEEPEELERKLRVSRNVEEHELKNALRTLPQHGEKMKELLLQLFNLEDPETAVQRTADRWIILPRYWIRMHHEMRDCYFHPDDVDSPVDGLLSGLATHCLCHLIALLLARMPSKRLRIGMQ